MGKRYIRCRRKDPLFIKEELMAKYLDFEGMELINNSFIKRIKDDEKKIAEMDTEIGLLKHDVKILKSVLIKQTQNKKIKPRRKSLGFSIKLVYKSCLIFQCIFHGKIIFQPLQKITG